MSKRSPASQAAQPVRAAELGARIDVALQPEPVAVTNGALELDPPRQAVMLEID